VSSAHDLLLPSRGENALDVRKHLVSSLARRRNRLWPRQVFWLPAHPQLP